MDDEKRIELMWIAYSSSISKDDFIKMVSREFSCTLEEAYQKTSYLFKG